MMDLLKMFVQLWLSLAIVKTIMGYVQLPLVLRIMPRYLGRKVTGIEIFALIVLSPLFTFLSTPVDLVKEKWKFFLLYEEEYVEEKLKSLSKSS